MNLGQNGQGVQLPGVNLEALGQQQAAQQFVAQIQGLLLGSAGVTLHGRSTVSTDDGVIELGDTDIPVVMVSGSLTILGVTGRDGGGRVSIPWHAVRALRGA